MYKFPVGTKGMNKISIDFIEFSNNLDRCTLDNYHSTNKLIVKCYSCNLIRMTTDLYKFVN